MLLNKLYLLVFRSRLIISNKSLAHLLTTTRQCKQFKQFKRSVRFNNSRTTLVQFNCSIFINVISNGLTIPELCFNSIKSFRNNVYVCYYALYAFKHAAIYFKLKFKLELHSAQHNCSRCGLMFYHF